MLSNFLFIQGIYGDRWSIAKWSRPGVITSICMSSQQWNGLVWHSGTPYTSACTPLYLLPHTIARASSCCEVLGSWHVVRLCVLDWFSYLLACCEWIGVRTFQHFYPIIRSTFTSTTTKSRAIISHYKSTMLPLARNPTSYIYDIHIYYYTATWQLGYRFNYQYHKYGVYSHSLHA